MRYLIVGGYAVALHGHPRYTKDLDIWIERDRSNAERLVHALGDFGVGDLGFSVEDFLEEDQIIQFGAPPNRIDILTTLPGVEFEDCYPSRVSVPVDDLTVEFIDLEHLREAKRASGRHQDLADLESLE